MSASVYYDDPRAAIDWLVRAFGFEVRVKVEGEGGAILHSELTYGDAVVMVNAARGKEPWQARHASPRSIGGRVTQSLVFYVDDVDAHYARAVAAHAEIAREPRVDDYGPEYWTDKTYGAFDSEGHLWWFAQRIQGPTTSGEARKP